MILSPIILNNCINVDIKIMSVQKNHIITYLGIIVSIIVGITSLYAQSKTPQTGLTLFFALLVAIFLYFFISWLIESSLKKTRNINKNTQIINDVRKDLNIVKDKLNFKSDVAKLDTRISILEQFSKMNKNKRGQIDLRVIVLIIIFILFFLFLKDKGII